MSMTRITNNPTMQLALLIRPHEDRLLSMRARSYDAYVMVDGQMMINPRPPLMSPNMARRSLFDVLALGVKNPGDSIRIVRLSDARIGVYFEDDADWRGRLAPVRVTWTGPWSLIGAAEGTPG